MVQLAWRCSMEESEVEVLVKDISLDPALKVPVVMLESKDGSAVLPIWIGAFEANSIALFFGGTPPARPLTHDLLVAILEAIGAKITRLVVTDLVDSIFLSLLFVIQDERQFAIDSRPSDGIALALRAGAPIFVRRRVYEKVAAQQSTATILLEDSAVVDEDEAEDAPAGKPDWRM